MRHLFFSTGELSGDRIVADIVTQLHRGDSSDLRITAVAGPHTERTGVRSLVESADLWVAGQTKNGLEGWSRVLNRIEPLLLESPPDVLIAVSHHAFNLPLVTRLKEQGLKFRSIMVAPPEAWAWDVRPFVRSLGWVLRRFILADSKELKELVPFYLDRAKSTVQSFDYLGCLFRLDAEFYRRVCQRERSTTVVKKIGHPFCSYAEDYEEGAALGQTIRDEALAFRRRNGLRSVDRLITIFPGSRLTEIEEHLAPMLVACFDATGQETDRSVTHIGISAASPKFTGTIASILSNVESIGYRQRASAAIFQEDADILLGASDYAVLCSGTVTLQAAVLGVPGVVGYRSVTQNRFLQKHKHLILRAGEIQTPTGSIPAPFTLPNALLGREIYRECVEEAFTAEHLTANLVALLHDHEAKANMAEASHSLLATELRSESGRTPAEEVADQILQSLSAPL